MAKIVLVTKYVNATSWQLAQALKSQQHEVILLTSYGENPPQNPNGFDFMGYFKRWSLLEALRLLPRILTINPQIIHLLLDEDQMNAAQVMLSTFAKSHPKCILTTSLLHIRTGLGRRNPVRYLIEESDIITCPTVETLGLLRGLNIRSTRQGRGILPPVLDLQAPTAGPQATDEDENHFVEILESKPYIVIPFREGKFRPQAESFLRILTIAQKYNVVLWGTYAHWPLRERKKFAAWMKVNARNSQWTVTGQTSPHINNTLLQKCAALLLAGQSLSPVEMTEYYMMAIRSHTGLILDSRQTSVHADLWKNEVNCWVLKHDDQKADLAKLMGRTSLSLPETLSEKLSEDRHLIDSSLNELNRLYNRALRHLR